MASNPDSEQVDKLALEAEFLTAECERHQARIAELEALVSLLQEDKATIHTALLDEAKERGWCCEYDEFVKNLNHKMKAGVFAPLRTWEFTIPVLVSVKVRGVGVRPSGGYGDALNKLPSVLRPDDHEYQISSTYLVPDFTEGNTWVAEVKLTEIEEG